MISRIHLTTIIIVVAIVWGALLIFDGVAVRISWLRYLSIVVGVVLLLLAIFDIWLWRLPFLRGWFVNRPNIRGTWRVTIQSTWRDPTTGEMIDLIEGYMVVRQTFSLLSMRLMTSDSASELLGVETIRFRDNTFRVAGVYRNEPEISVRHRSHMHNGAFLLHVVGAPVSALNGHYWTDRGTIGNIRSTGRRKEILYDFETASRALNAEDAAESEG